MADVNLDHVSRWWTGAPRPRTGARWGHPLELIPGLIRALDIVIIAVVGMAVAAIHDGTVFVPTNIALITGLVTLIAANFLHAADVYKADASGACFCRLGRVFALWTVVICGLIVVLYFLKVAEEVPRSWIAGWYVLGGAGLSLIRFAASRGVRTLHQTGRSVIRLAIFADDATAQKLIERMKSLNNGSLSLVGVFAPPPSGDGSLKAAIGSKGTTEDLIALTRLGEVDEIVVALPSYRMPRLRDALNSMRSTPVNVSICVPELFDIDLRPGRPWALPGLPLISISERPLTGWNGFVKIAEDFIIAAVALVICAPVMTITAALIALDSPGPILFRQIRHGFNDQTITVYKFRTMYHSPICDAGAVQARRGDPRVTRIGYFLRRTSLDELPQLFNVLRGDMSLVGPRPHPIPLDDKYAAMIDNYLGRLRVRPGITGLAQVNGCRGETDTIEKMRSRIEHDLKYINEWSLLLDLRILFRTLLVGFVHPHAY